jgi:cytochrome c oxidase subunit 1
MIVFAFGGVGGVINASYNVNLVIHNTAWVPGHFHTTVGTGVTLTFIGILYWLIPHFTGKALWGRKAALWQAWLWTIGVGIFSQGLHRLGLLGAPRRTMLGVATDNYGTPEWLFPRLMTGLGGTIMLISFIVFLVVVIQTLRNKEMAKVEMPVAEPLHQESIPAWRNCK